MQGGKDHQLLLLKSAFVDCCRFLDISFNKLTSLSADLSAFDGLSILNLSYNTLGTFPDVVSCMTCLRELNLDSTGATYPCKCTLLCQYSCETREHAPTSLGIAGFVRP